MGFIKLPDDIKELVKTEVDSTFVLNSYTCFDEFWDDVEVANAYEEEWIGLKNMGVKEIYRQVYNERG